jgi:hypothetical protein
LLDEPVLLGPRPPVLFCVRNAEPEQAVVCRIPDEGLRDVQSVSKTKA